jgi:hypothetical protein
VLNSTLGGIEVNEDVGGDSCLGSGSGRGLAYLGFAGEIGSVVLKVLEWGSLGLGSYLIASTRVL